MLFSNSPVDSVDDAGKIKLPGFVNLSARRRYQYSKATKALERSAPFLNVHVTSATHEIAVALTSFAARRKYATVLYDDMERGFCPQFPWFELFDKLKYKLDGSGIALRRASAGKVEPAM